MARIWNKHKQTKTPLKRKVFIAMSGGVDSSVAATLLLRQGYEVTGAFMKQTSASSVEPWSDEMQNAEYRMQNVCTWKQDRREALRVAAHLGIPLLTLDFEKEYKEWVMGYMFREYEAGRTPNPDVLCNKWIKFGAWLAKAREMGFEYLATGHYARIGEESRMLNIELRKKKKIPYSIFHLQLLEAKDKNKDQTYFLHQLNQEQLQHTLFPIGGYTKPQVRALARKFKLPTAERAESMGICFVGEIPMKEFLQNKIKTKIGDIVMTSGEVVGKHDGLSFYTIGQRHGLSLRGGAQATTKQSHSKKENNQIASSPSAPRNDSKPLFIVGKNEKKNELIVGYEDDPLLWKKEIEVGEVNWVSGLSPKFPLECKVRMRHRQELQNCRIVELENKTKMKVVFEKPQKAVTPGQFAVFYRNGECLGGGVIM